MNVIIFGAAANGSRIGFKLFNEGHNILFAIDNNIKLIGKKLNIRDDYSIDIKKPIDVLDYDFDEIIIASQSAIDMKEQLLILGVPSYKINTNFMLLQVEARIQAMKNFSIVANELGLEGECAEVGVFRGDFAKEINICFPNKKLYLFDTFEGFDDKDKTSFEELNTDYSYTSESFVLSRMKYPENCFISKGYFPDSINGLEDKFCFVSLDPDLYKPILSGLEYFYPRLVEGGGSICS